VNSGESTDVMVNVTCNGRPVEGAFIVMSSTHGIFADPSNFTNSIGHYGFELTVPITPVQLTTTIVANVTKNGYVDATNQMTITIVPEVAEPGGGWSWVTILLILIPVVIAIVIVVLIKFGIISFSTKEEESAE
jgi:hypothetical protein